VQFDRGSSDLPSPRSTRACGARRGRAPGYRLSSGQQFPGPASRLSSATGRRARPTAAEYQVIELRSIRPSCRERSPNLRSSTPGKCPPISARRLLLDAECRSSAEVPNPKSRTDTELEVRKRGLTAVAGGAALPELCPLRERQSCPDDYCGAFACTATSFAVFRNASSCPFRERMMIIVSLPVAASPRTSSGQLERVRVFVGTLVCPLTSRWALPFRLSPALGAHRPPQLAPTPQGAAPNLSMLCVKQISCHSLRPSPSRAAETCGCPARLDLPTPAR